LEELTATGNSRQDGRMNININRNNKTLGLLMLAVNFRFICTIFEPEHFDA
jgi:hypothetical protein